MLKIPREALIVIAHKTAHDLRSPTSQRLLESLERLLTPQAFAQIQGTRGEALREELVAALGRGAWVETLVVALEKLIATNVSGSRSIYFPDLSQLPKKKSPLLLPVTRLITAPLALLSPGASVPLLVPLLTDLLAIPALPSALPIPALTLLSTSLPVFQAILPLAGRSPELLSQGRLDSEAGRTYFLANLATFGITGGLLERNGATSAVDWIKVVGTILRSMTDGWGRWVEGIQEEEDVPMPSVEEIDSDDDEPGPSQPRRERSIVRRPPLPKNISSKILLLASKSHLTFLTNIFVSPSSKLPTSIISDFAAFALNLLGAFRGSPKWEGVLEALLIETKGKAFSKRVWREGVRGRWRETSNAKSWDTFMDSESKCGEQ